MAKQSRTPPRPAAKVLTAQRATRLVRLLHLLDAGPQDRRTLLRQLRLDLRGFYRDLDLLRGVGIPLPLEQHRYHLRETVERAVERIPFPDPHLTLGEARQLAKGRSAVHRKLKEQIEDVLGRLPSPKA